MGQNFSDVCRTLAEYHCPRYEELPHIALYKDQVVSVLNEAVGPFYPQGETPVTATMVNNYVKMKLLAPPEKKKYSTGQIAYLYVIFLLKQVLSIGEIAALLRMQQRCCACSSANTRRPMHTAVSVRNWRRPCGLHLPRKALRRRRRLLCRQRPSFCALRCALLPIRFMP